MKKMKKNYYLVLLVLLPYTFMAQVVTTFAGSGVVGALDATGTAASFKKPVGVALDAAGNLYVADTGNNIIRKITASGVVTTFAGSGATGSDDGNGINASFNSPNAVVVDASGTLFVADSFNHKIRKITAAGVVSTFAGSGTSGSDDATGIDASFFQPWDIAVDASGNLYVADFNNHKIRKITIAGVVSTFAGSGTTGSSDATGTAATFFRPTGITFDNSGTMYVVDSGNHKIRKITTTGVVSTLAGSTTSGSNDGSGTSAQFFNPYDLAVDASGTVYVTDFGNHKIRMITAAGVVSTFAGASTFGSNDGSGTSAQFSRPAGITIDAAGILYIGDRENHKIRKITTALATSDFDFNSKVSIYPNPSNSIFNIAIDINATIGVYDLLGKQLLSKKIELGTTALDMTAYQAGIYLLKVINENNQSKTIKIVKE
jgi:sugar lactone lactonase YvrE